MADPRRKIRCKYNNSGYCKYEDRCKFIHHQSDCTNFACKDKQCSNRHPKDCRYKEECRRRSRCVYKHTIQKVCLQTNSTNSEEIEKLQDTNHKLKSEIEALSLKIKVMDDKTLELENHLKSAKLVARAFKRTSEKTIVELAILEAKHSVLEKKPNDIEHESLNQPPKPQTSNEEPINKCKYCNQKFGTKKTLTKHYKYYYACVTCNMCLKTQNDADKHSEKDDKCQIKFKHEIDFDREYPFQCDLCPQGFKSENEMNIHMKIPFYCRCCGECYFKENDHVDHYAGSKVDWRK